jgi:hypothetical protein
MINKISEYNNIINDTQNRIEHKLILQSIKDHPT